MDISEVAQRSGLPSSTLRYYEERGLIESIGRRGLRRTFDRGVLRRLALIALGRSAGFSLKEITTLIGPGGQTTLDRQMLAAKADELDATIGKLAVMRDELRRAAACPAPSHSECEKFQSHVDTAAVGTRRRVRTRMASKQAIASLVRK
jgi:DNA-binding transcriptional MerR regulator